MHFIILGILIILLVFGPRWWVGKTLRQHGHERADLSGTGGELAEHLVERFDLKNVRVIEGRFGEDYYNPEEKVVSLSPPHYQGKSLAAVAVAAHEVGHALQHQEQHKGFMRRQKRIRLAMVIERVSALALLITPALFLITKVPQSTLLTLFIGGSGMLAALWVQCMNLPIEIDASFNKAMPILSEGYLSNDDLPLARKVLWAAAITYVASTLASLLNVGRWIAILRR